MDFDEQIKWTRGLDRNWDGRNGVPPLECVIDNVEKFNGLVAGAGFGDLAEWARLMPSPTTGDITIRYGLWDKCVFVLVGRDCVCWCLGGPGWDPDEDLGSEIVECDFTSLPEGLVRVLGDLS